MLASSGLVDLYTLQRLLTHKSPAMTQRYAHLRDDALKGAAEVASTLVNKSRRKKSDNSQYQIVEQHDDGQRKKNA